MLDYQTWHINGARVTSLSDFCNFNSILLTYDFGEVEHLTKVGGAGVLISWRWEKYAI
jgi:hypothetical protein